MAAQPTPLTAKTIWGAAGAVTAVVTMIAVLHSNFMLPTIVAEADRNSREIVAHHETRPHIGAVSRDEFNRAMNLLGELATKESIELVNQRLEQLTESLDSVKERLGALEAQRD
ncbi:MAG: hypothetical protein B7733_06295 [Myxococcales bacterium FL481]|nr:MAG: hypothetical protein B7733_06295 [Myxococcales bacterium FL481]